MVVLSGCSGIMIYNKKGENKWGVLEVFQLSTAFLCGYYVYGGGGYLNELCPGSLM